MTRNHGSKTIVMTGALGSIGSAAARQLARQGAHLVLLHRDEARSAEAAAQLSALGARVDRVHCDLASLDSVRRAALEIAERFPVIDVLVNNAAVYSRARRLTVDGNELMLGVNHLAPYLLTRALEAPLARAHGARVVCVTMQAKRPVDLDDLDSAIGYDPMTAFTQSKAAGQYFVRELAERWASLGIRVTAVNPRMTRTTLVREAPLPLRLVFALLAAPPDKGADTVVWAATAPRAAALSATMLERRKPVPFVPGAEDPVARLRLWQQSAVRVGLDPEPARRRARPGRWEVGLLPAHELL